jgi:hypothetical protein
MSDLLPSYYLPKQKSTNKQIRVAVGKYVQNLRERLGWSVETLCLKFDTQKVLWEQFEKGICSLADFADEDVIYYLQENVKKLEGKR